MTCAICHGVGTVRLPMRRPIALPEPIESDPTRDKAWRTYPCPECSEAASEERIVLVESRTIVDTQIADGPIEAQRFIDHVKKQTARSLVVELERSGYILATCSEEDKKTCTCEVKATIGVVSRRVAARLEDRIAARQGDVAHAVVERALNEIQSWRRDRRDAAEDIPKDQVRAALTNALDAIVGAPTRVA